jgi:hypothetical protein
MLVDHWQGTMLCDLVDETLNRLPAFQLACFIMTRRPGTSRRKWDLHDVRCAHRIPQRSWGTTSQGRALLLQF